MCPVSEGVDFRNSRNPPGSSDARNPKILRSFWPKLRRVMPPSSKAHIGLSGQVCESASVSSASSVGRFEATNCVRLLACFCADAGLLSASIARPSNLTVSSLAERNDRSWNRPWILAHSRRALEASLSAYASKAWCRMPMTTRRPWLLELISARSCRRCASWSLSAAASRNFPSSSRIRDYRPPCHEFRNLKDELAVVIGHTFQL